MKPYIEPLRTEIAKDFAHAHVVEVNGCQMEWSNEVPWYFCDAALGINPFTPDRFLPDVPKPDNAPYSEWH